MSGKIKIEMHPGTDIQRASEDAQHIADVLRIDVQFSFNGVTCTAQSGGHALVLAEAWDAELRRELRGPLDTRRAYSLDRKRQLSLAIEAARVRP